MAKYRNSEKNEWKIVREIGKGGNGTVYEVKDKSGKKYALKELTKVKNNKSYQRFKDEVEVLGHLKDKSGIVNIIDSYLPSKVVPGDMPFYVMPIGQPLVEFLKGKSHEVIFQMFVKVSKALEHLHSLGITHRDIKPANILVIDGEPVLSDFGLSHFPKKKKVSATNEPIGAKWTIAPEMQRISSSAEFKIADVYSLAKTLWILLTGVPYGFEGQYIPRSSISLEKYVDVLVNTVHMSGRWYYFSIVLLERLLIDSTSNDPDKRPTVSSFIQRLEYWMESNDDYFKRNAYEWEDAVKRIFPISIPEHSEWEKIDEIISVLQILTEYDNLNHSFFPDGGGFDIELVEKAKENNCLVIEESNIGKPAKLVFEKIENLEWSYFRLDLATLTPLTITTKKQEELYIDEAGTYSESKANDNKNVRRYLEGSFVIVYKTSVINALKGPMNGYTGIHNTMDATEYRKLLSMVKAKIEEIDK